MPVVTVITVASRLAAFNNNVVVEAPRSDIWAFDVLLSKLLQHAAKASLGLFVLGKSLACATATATAYCTPSIPISGLPSCIYSWYGMWFVLACMIATVDLT